MCVEGAANRRCREYVRVRERKRENVERNWEREALTEVEKQYENDNIISNKKCFYEIQYYLYHPDDVYIYMHIYIYIYKYLYLYTLYLYIVSDNVRERGMCIM